MRNALTMLLIGMGQIILAALYPHAAWLLLWSGLSFGIVGTAYAFQKPRVFGKRLDGTLAWGNCLLLLPYLLLTWLLWYCQTHLTFEAASHEIVPGLWLGAGFEGGIAYRYNPHRRLDLGVRGAA